MTTPNSKAITLQDFIKTPIPITPNKFEALQDYPPLTYANATTSTSSPSPAYPINPNANINASTKNAFPYITKPIVDHIELTRYLQIPLYSDLLKYVSNTFSPDKFWISPDLAKDLQFYQLILLDSQSIEIFHTYDPQDSSKISFSKVIIKKVLNRRDWSAIASKDDYKQFSIPYEPSHYNYEDYIQAWNNAFFLRPFNHSWFFMFCRTFNSRYDEIPIWFFLWLIYYGPLDTIYDHTTKIAFQTFNQQSSQSAQIPDYAKILQFHNTMKLPWIFCWNFKVMQYHQPPFPMSLVREFKIKWWDKCRITVDMIHAHFREQNLISRSHQQLEKRIATVATPSMTNAVPTMTKAVVKPEYADDDYDDYMEYKKKREQEKNKNDKANSEEGSSSDPYDFIYK